MKKLYILRVIIISALTTVISIFSVFRKAGIKEGIVRLEYPMRWLRHYLIGSGKSIEVPSWIVKEGTNAMKVAIEEANIAYEDQFEGFDPYANKYEGLLRPYCVYHSTLYEGSGFYGRPILFYLLGGFTFRLYYNSKNNQFMVSGKDHYDWHSTVADDGSHQYFTSPLGTSKFVVFLVHLVGKIFGNEYFVTEGFPMDEAGISNRLWEDMKKVGAKEFNSYFVNQPIDIVCDIDIDNLLSSFPQTSWGGYIIKNETTEKTVVTICNDIIASVEEYDETDGYTSQYFTTLEKVRDFILQNA